MNAVPRRSPLAVLGLPEYQPPHPYGVQRLLKHWGKESVVNVGQRATLYKTMAGCSPKVSSRSRRPAATSSTPSAPATS